MSNSDKPVLRAVAVQEEGLVTCCGCYFNTPKGFTCNVGDSAGAAAPAQCCNYDGYGKSVIFKEVQSVPIRNPA